MENHMNTIPPVTKNDINPLIERAYVPGETHTLPSGGLFYKNGELSNDVKNGEITVNPMTAIMKL